MRDHSRAEAGFSLSEMLVASAIFLFVAMAAYTALNESNKAYKRGDQYAEMQQRTRLAFDQMMLELRLAGFDYNRDGDSNEYPDHTDEQVEWLGAHAILFRGNLDYADEDTGRESDYETDPSDPAYGTVCCPVVTVANDEIVAYALRSETSSRNTGSITASLDTSIPRDGGWDGGGMPANEETVTISNIELTGSYPPYTLVRFTLADDGSLVERPVATDVRNLNFTFQGDDGLTTYCLNPAADGSCPSGQELAFTSVGGADDYVAGDMKRRAARAAVRRITAELVGMTETAFKNYSDSDTVMPDRPKLSLEAAVIPQNLGLKGKPDLIDATNLVPMNVTVCGGQCNTIRVEWDDMLGATGYNVKLYTPSGPDPFFTGVTPGVAIPGSAPARVFAVFQRLDSATIVNGARIYARVQARFPGDKTSDDSIPSLVTDLLDVVRPEAATDVKATGYDTRATGWPDVSTNLVPPDTTNTSGNGAKQNHIVVSWKAPFWALNVTDQANPATTWTTRASTGLPAIDCDRQDADTNGDGINDTTRTRLREHYGTVRYLVFRSTNPRFVPTNADFVAAIPGTVDSTTGRVSFTDKTVHVFTNGIFNRTDQAVANCTTYYYRIRAVDDCWDGTNPAGPSDLHLSPFAPALNTSPSANDSDDVTTVNPADVGVAIPGYAIPKAAPRQVLGPRFNAYDRRTDDGDGRDATVAFDAVKLDSTMNGATAAYEDVTITEYQVYSHATNPNFTLADMKGQLNGVRLDKVVRIADAEVRAGRISRDDENADGTITTAEDESVPNYGEASNLQPRSGLRVDLEPTSSRWYKVVAVQCRSEDTVPDSDPTSFDFGIPSVAVKFPCDFGGGQYSTITINSTNFPTSVTSDANMEDPTVTSPYTRLVLKDRATGDRAITASPGKAPSNLGGGLWRTTFNSSDIAALTDNFGGGDYLISVEWDDSNGCLGVSDSDSQVIAPPACCLAAGVPVMTRPTTTSARNTVTVNCSAQAIRFMKFTVTVDNANGGPQEKFASVSWDDPDSVDDRTWTTNRTSDSFDTTADPPVLGLTQTGVLNMTFSRNVSGDNVTVTYDYKIGGAAGQCTFTMRMP